ncbi:Uncharacterised protein [Klebsiella pneumoniae]|nr:Uncharacterised protein [Klebsiella pneumoniae]
MHLENCLEDMNVISNALATVTSNASRFSNANSTPKAFPKRVHTKFKMRPRFGGLTRSTRPGFADSHEFRLPQTEGIQVTVRNKSANLSVKAVTRT